MGIAELTAEIAEAFHCSRPDRMVRNPGHCKECAEHEEVMQSVTPDSVSLTQVGSAAWDPVCFLSDEAYQYFMPGLARLAAGRGNEYYLDQFLFHLESGRIDDLDVQQCRAIADLLDNLYETMADEIGNNMDGEALGRVMEHLEQRLATLQTSR